MGKFTKKEFKKRYDDYLKVVINNKKNIHNISLDYFFMPEYDSEFSDQDRFTYKDFVLIQLSMGRIILNLNQRKFNPDKLKKYYE